MILWNRTIYEKWGRIPRGLVGINRVNLGIRRDGLQIGWVERLGNRSRREVGRRNGLSLRVGRGREQSNKQSCAGHRKQGQDAEWPCWFGLDTASLHAAAP